MKTNDIEEFNELLNEALVDCKQFEVKEMSCIKFWK